MGFSLDGGTVLVTTKAANTVDTFTVGADGLLSAAPLHNPTPSPMPFGFAFDDAGHLLVTEAGMDSSVSSFGVGSRRRPDGPGAERAQRPGGDVLGGLRTRAPVRLEHRLEHPERLRRRRRRLAQATPA